MSAAQKAQKIRLTMAEIKLLPPAYLREIKGAVEVIKAMRDEPAKKPA